MKALINRQSIIIAAAALLLALITFISVNVFGTVGPVTNLGNAVSRPIRALSSTITGIFERIYFSIYRYDALMQRYELVVADNAELRMNFREAQALADENAMLRMRLEFRDRNPDHDSEMARFQNWSGSNWSHSFTINRGYANSNISTGNAVVT